MYKYSEISAALSHLKAIHTAWSDGAKVAMITEDDVSYVTTPLWKHAFAQIMAAAPPGWQMLRLHTMGGGWHNKRLQDLCAQDRAFIPWQRQDVSATAYLLNREGMDVLHREAGWPDLAKLSSFLTRAVTTPIDLNALAKGKGKAGKAAPDDIIPRNLWPHAHTFTRPLFLTSFQPSALQTAGTQYAGEHPTNLAAAAFYRCGQPPWQGLQCAPLKMPLLPNGRERSPARRGRGRGADLRLKEACSDSTCRDVPE